MGEWLGDLLYPDNPGRRAHVNQLHQDVVDLQNLITDDINTYNHVLPLARNLATQNALLRAIQAAFPFTREDLRKFQDHDLEPTETPTWEQVLDTGANIGLSVAVPMLLKALWNYGKAARAARAAGQALPEVAAPEAAAGLARVSEVEMAELSAVNAVDGVRGAEELGAREASELAGGEAAEAVGTEAAGAASASMRLAGEASGRALRMVFKTGAGVALAVGVELALAGIEGGQERSSLEGKIADLTTVKNALAPDHESMQERVAALEQASRTAIDQYNLIHRDFEENYGFDDIPTEKGKVFGEHDRDGAIASQTILVNHFYKVLETFQSFRKLRQRHADFDEHRADYFDEMIDMGLVENAQEAERRYQLMSKIDNDLAARSATATPGSG
ncbi:hypothetical protein [Pseudonocardia sp.]|jgi:hypothetical protein|uniref:hypothetical protein n=1 Tax=Pseudonocardia sp. TaxID=60912 RepID=UPI002616FB2C|nr:hypothetical protein [Pseudonocardia sp.]MCW2716186.1 hypothetical protein [Pseudonocardia sp.]MDX6584810.1 hypothetical protein [Solirubrobacterales bacterium]